MNKDDIRYYFTDDTENEKVNLIVSAAKRKYYELDALYQKSRALRQLGDSFAFDYLHPTLTYDYQLAKAQYETALDLQKILGK